MKQQRYRAVMSAFVGSICVISALNSGPPVHAKQTPTSQAATPAVLALTTDSPIGITSPGSRIVVHLATPPAETAEAKRSWRAVGLDGVTIAQGVLPQNAGGDLKAFSFTPPSAFRGILYITLDSVDDAGAVVAHGETRVAVIDTSHDPKVPSSLPCLYAACAHLGGDLTPDSQRQIDAMQAAGFGGCRFDYNWGRVQPRENAWEWSGYDAIFTGLQKARVLPLPILGYSVRWASTGDPNSKNWHDWNNAPPRTEPYTAFLTESVKRYRSYTHYWEIWNEPDIAFWLGTPEQYADLLNASVTAAHKADPEVRIMNGGFSETRRRPEFIPTLLAHLTARPDVYAFHSHGNLQNLERATATNRQYLADAKIAGLPFWDNESGYSNIHGGTEREQASQLIKKMSYAPSQGIAAYALYDLRNDGDDPNENEHNFGIIRHDFSPKASFVAVHTFLSRVSGKTFRREVPLGGSAAGRGYLFDDPKNGALLVFWGDLPVGAERDILINTGAKSGDLRLIDLMGSEQPLKSHAGLARLTLRREPQFLALPSADAARLVAVPPVLEAPEAVSSGPGEPWRTRVTLHNPLSKPLSATLTARAVMIGPADKAEKTEKAATTGLSVTLAPGETQSREIAVPALPSVNVGSRAAIRVTLQAPALEEDIVADTEVRTALVAPLIADTGNDASPSRRPNATLHVHPNGVSLFLATPMRELQLRDDEDINASIWVGHTAHAIVLDVRVRDDSHVQNETPAEMWKGDSLQFAIAAPGQQNYEWTFGLTPSGPVTHAESSPAGANTAVSTTIRRVGNDTIYRVTVPDTLPGIADALAKGCKLDVLINDNDGQGRKGWLEWTPGIGMTKDTTPFVPVIFR